MLQTFFARHIPVARAAAVEAALQQAFGTTAVTAISPLAGGLSASSVYKITVHDRPYVLKLDTVSPVETTAVSANLQRAAQAGIAPPLYYQAAASGISISGFIANKPVRAAFAPAKLIAELAATIKAIHGVPCPDGGRDLRDTVDDMI